MQREKTENEPTKEVEPKKFLEMSMEDQISLITKIGVILKENDLEDAEVQWSTYKVADMVN